MKYIPKIDGERVFLSPISLEDAERYALWLNDLSTTRFLQLSTAQVTIHGERDALVNLSKAHNYAIVERTSGELLGNCGLMDLDHLHRTAEIGIFIGEESMRGRGYGTEAMRLLADYAFNVLNINNLMLRTYDYNDRGLASYHKLGFREIGRRRQARFYGGGFHDVVYMDLLAAEFGPSRLPPAREGARFPA
jgi:RimJ/RimL family protein N-acetyltransferase